MKFVHPFEASAVRECLITARKRRKLTQARLARLLGKPQSFVSKYETGQRRLDIAEFLKIAANLGPDPRALIDDILRAAPSLRTRIRRRAAQ